LQLRFAGGMPSYGPEAEKLEFEAVNSLRALEARGDIKTEMYPLVTLALLHTGLHVTHGRDAEARKLAEGYLAEVQRAERSSNDPALGAVKETMLKLLTLGVWERPKFQSGFFMDS